MQEYIGGQQNDAFGSQRLMFDKVHWSNNQPQLLHFEWLKPSSAEEKLERIFNQRLRKSRVFYKKSSLTFFHDFAISHPIDVNNPPSSGQNNLQFLYNNDQPDKDFWIGNILMKDGRISLFNVQLREEAIMNGATMIHDHDVLQSLDFLDIGLTFSFKDINDQNLLHDVHIDLLAPPIYDSYLGTSGNLGSDKKFHLGIVQSFVYYLRVPIPSSTEEQIARVTVDLSISFRRPDNDFEPFGAIDAALIFPQIRFEAQYVSTKEYPEVLDILSNPSNFNTQIVNVPPNALAKTAFISAYRGRVRCVTNVNNSHHVDLTTVNGTTYDKNHFSHLRQEKGSPIPFPIFEKYFQPSIGKNIPSVYSDSNSQNFERMYPWYSIDEATFNFAKEHIIDTDLLRVFPPTWAYIFDYQHILENEEEFMAVYSHKDTGYYNALEKRFYGTSERNQKYNYPVGNPTSNYIDLKKMPRQGEFDNIHLHGYMGHYLDNDKIVRHAPICGFCCFHMHWRWSELNYNLNKTPIIRILAKGNPYRFNGWSATVGTYKESNRLPGNPLVPPNQSVKVAMTRPETESFNRFYVLDPNNTTSVSLDPDVKAVWYSCEIDNVPDFDSSHVILEQGVGFAFRYNKRVKLLLNNISELLMLVAEVYYDPPMSPVSPRALLASAKPEDWFEIIYRLMRFFNSKPNSSQPAPYADMDQVPDGSFIDTSNTNPKTMQKL